MNETEKLWDESKVRLSNNDRIKCWEALVFTARNSDNVELTKLLITIAKRVCE